MNSYYHRRRKVARQRLTGVILSGQERPPESYSHSINDQSKSKGGDIKYEPNIFRRN